jgi:hypothetical protein
MVPFPKALRPARSKGKGAMGYHLVADYHKQPEWGCSLGSLLQLQIVQLGYNRKRKDARGPECRDTIPMCFQIAGRRLVDAGSTVRVVPRATKVNTRISFRYAAAIR